MIFPRMHANKRELLGGDSGCDIRDVGEAKPSFGDSCITKLELGNEGLTS